MSYCVNCGAELPKEDAKFCPYCGLKQPVDNHTNAVADSVHTTQNASVNKVPASKPNKKNSCGNSVLALVGVIVCVLIFLFLAAVTAVFVFGMSDDVQGSSEYSYSSLTSKTPQQVFDIYFNGFKNVDDDAIWGVLSTGAKSDESKNLIYNTIYALHSQGMRYNGYSVNDFQSDGNTGEMSITVEFEANGYKISKDKQIPFVRENDVWKIDNFVRIP